MRGESHYIFLVNDFSEGYNFFFLEKKSKGVSIYNLFCYQVHGSLLK